MIEIPCGNGVLLFFLSAAACWICARQALFAAAEITLLLTSIPEGNLKLKPEIIVFFKLVIAFLVEGEASAFAAAAVVVRTGSGVGGTCFRSDAPKQGPDVHAAHLAMLSIIMPVIVVFHLVEDAGLQDFLVEIAAVELHAEDGFIQSLQLRDSKLFIQKSKANRFKVNVLARPRHRLP